MGLRQYKYELTLADKKERTPNTGLAKVAVHYSADTFMVNQNLVLYINICGENRHLHQALVLGDILTKHTQTKRRLYDK